MQLNEIFDKLWKQYSSANPSVGRIHELFENEGETIVNDHIAFRTFDDPRVSIDVLSRPFKEAGFKEAGSYDFPVKKLYAKHFEKEGYPRVFISELMVGQFSNELQSAVKDMIDKAEKNEKLADPLVLSGNVFGKPEASVYEKLRTESEYAAWMYAYGYRANHFTVSINHLHKYNTIQKLNEFLKSNGFELNSSGGEIKGSPQQLLEQSSTLADRVMVEFIEGKREIPSCYYEFARRFPDKDGHVFSGFISESADKIFESTNFRK